MWDYYGTKTSLVGYYPKPKFNKIIEPFAGAAKYSLKYFDMDVHLYDKYERIIGNWIFLQSCSERDIRKLPILKVGQDIRDFNLSIPEQNFMQFIVGVALNVPCWKCSPFNTQENQQKRLLGIEKNLFKIKHWKFYNKSYDEIPNEKATWFIDPPYVDGGHKYKHSNKSIDYAHLAEYCKERDGHTIVCENSSAEWLPFNKISELNGMYRKTTEVMWTNYPTSYKQEQLNLF